MDFREQFIQVFRLLDSDKDDCLSPLEVDKGLLNPHLTSRQAAVVAILKTKFSQITALHKDGPLTFQSGISLKDLVKLIAIMNATDSASDSTGEKIREQALALMARIDALSTKPVSLYDTGRLGIGRIRPEAVLQGNVGNCSFMAALASLAAVSPKTIKKSITDNKNDTYTVTFAGAPTTPFVVAQPTLAERALYAQDGQFGCWPAILEKAYGCYHRSTSFDPKIIDAENTEGSKYWPEIFALLTGQWARLVDIEAEQSEIPAILDKAFKESRSVCAWSAAVTREAIANSHVYSVLSWSSEKKLLTLYNPWGGVPGAEPLDEAGTVADGRLDGLFTFTIEQLCINFEYLHVEEWSDGATLIQEQKPEDVTKNKQSRKLSNVIRVPIGFAVLGLALAAGACIEEQSRVQMVALNWPKTTAELYIPGQTISAPKAPESHLPYFKEFEYRYTVNGRNYQGRDSVGYADLVYENDELANAGNRQKIKISYNPQNPAESRLRPGLHLVAAGSGLFTIMMAGGAALMSLIMLLLCFGDPPERKRRKDHNNITSDLLVFWPVMQNWVPTKWRAKILHVLKVVF